MNRKGIILIVVLVLLEQAIKLVIDLNQWTTLTLIPNIVSFDPVVNRHLSFFHSILKITPSRGFRLVFLFILIVLFALIYDYIHIKGIMNRIICIMFVFVFAGFICSFIDTLVWNGSLDYIRLHGLFVFDLKDIYITIPEVSLYTSAVIYRRQIKTLDEKKIIKEFWTYLKSKFTI